MPLDQGESLTTRLNTKYHYGFRTKVSSVQLPPGLSENTVRWLVEQRKEPKFMLKWRLEGFRALKKMQQPTWGKLNLKPIDLQKISYYSAPKSVVRKAPRSLNEVDPKLLDAYKKLGIPLHEQYKLAGVAVDAVFDSVSVATTFKANLAELGVIFCPFSEALKLYPELVEKYLGSVVSNTDNYFAALNAAIFSDGSFVYIPKGVHCPIELSTYFRINAAKTGQFERTLIVADENSFVSYLEGCSAPARDTNQLHAAVVELVALDRAEIKYATVQNWYPGDSKGRGGIFNLVTKRGECRGAGSHISWTQLETGSAITWKYPSTILKGEGSHSEFYSVAITNNYQQADTGSKMIHLGANTRSLIISKGISAGGSTNTYRGLVSINKSASGAYNYTKCDSLIMGKLAKAHTFPKIVNETESATTEHEASTTKISAEQLFYCQQRGLDEKDSLSLIVNGFCREVFQKLPMEFMVEAYKLVELTLEGAYQC